jgi:hypothetical protein
MTKRLAVLLVALTVAASAWAVGLQYSSGATGLAITQTNLTTSFTDNHSGGTDAAFQARAILIRPRTGSDTCHVDLGDGVATTADTALPAGSTFIKEWDPTTGGVGGGFDGFGAICGTGETATWDVDAWR